MGCSRSWLVTGISIKKNGGVKFFLWAYTNHSFDIYQWPIWQWTQLAIYVTNNFVFRIQNMSCAHSQYGKRKDDPFNASVFSLVSSNFSHFVDWRKSKRNQWVKSEAVKRRKTDNANLVKWKKDKKKNNCRQNATQKVTIDQPESL